MNGKSIKKYKTVNINNFERIIKSLPIEEAKKGLRQIRKEECFSMVDRPIWYKRLNEEQKYLVDKWYEQWLDVTSTFVEPIRPYGVKW